MLTFMFKVVYPPPHLSVSNQLTSEVRGEKWGAWVEEPNKPYLLDDRSQNNSVHNVHCPDD